MFCFFFFFFSRAVTDYYCCFTEEVHEAVPVECVKEDMGHDLEYLVLDYGSAYSRPRGLALHETASIF
uniref:Putative secreted protein ovary overexpressed n=1 Tax=Rhipicephalus microplus TaxID=6941 RepID=A0A6M2DCS5_RHIMP